MCVATTRSDKIKNQKNILLPRILMYNNYFIKFKLINLTFEYKVLIEENKINYLCKHNQTITLKKSQYPVVIRFFIDVLIRISYVEVFLVNVRIDFLVDPLNVFRNYCN